MGERVPADMVLIQGQDVECLEADLTGEPDGSLKSVITHQNYKDGHIGTMMA